MDFKVFNHFTSVIDYFHKYGVVKGIGYIAIIGMIVFLIYSTVYTDVTLAKLDTKIDESVKRALTEQTEALESKHTDGIEKRMGNLEEINNTLRETMYEVGADRASIIEMHNGTNNMVGLPFLYGEMTYEQVRRGIQHVDDLYEKINLTRYEFPTYLMNNHSFIGSVDEGMAIDDKICYKMKGEGTSYIAIFTIYGEEQVIGFFCVSWCNEKVVDLDKNDVATISAAAQKLSALLDK